MRCCIEAPARCWVLSSSGLKMPLCLGEPRQETQRRDRWGPQFWGWVQICTETQVHLSYRQKGKREYLFTLKHMWLLLVMRRALSYTNRCRLLPLNATQSSRGSPGTRGSAKALNCQEENSAWLLEWFSPGPQLR